MPKETKPSTMPMWNKKSPSSCYENTYLNENIKKEIEKKVKYAFESLSETSRVGYFCSLLECKESEVQEYKQIAEDKQTLVDQYEREIQELKDKLEFECNCWNSEIKIKDSKIEKLQKENTRLQEQIERYQHKIYKKED